MFFLKKPFLVVRVDIGVVTYETMTPQCGRSVVQVLVIVALYQLQLLSTHARLSVFLCVCVCVCLSVYTVTARYL